ncbi:hypothetical protein CDL12_19004 [Handroanthus impetiginosus]|uniref:Protein TIFY n=1 Tax=Handroanthus impetiginosus TaxID=429701 RepID=A0A2G9GT63_9LAMI|nr:hypothetical protein CDL12_19004 [Handroanthus impetiginosus]
MGSSEIVDSGKFSGGRSTFSQTCSLLSQYLKEKGSFGDLTLGLTQSLEPKGAPTETMNLLPMIEKSGSRHPLAAGRDEAQTKSELSGTKSQPETAQMTIFYAGQVIVFNDFPADKAREIMMFASKSNATQNHPNAAFAPPHTAQSPAESTTTSIQNIVPTFGIQDRPRHSAQMRKNSLARFLEKRKDRVTANAPYPAIKPAAAAPKTANGEPWLGLARQLHQN